MKRLVLVYSLLLFPVSAVLAQTTSKIYNEPNYPTNMERIGVDFEIKDVDDPNEDLVNQIDLNKYEDFRTDNDDVEVNDEESGYVLIMYARNKATQNKLNLLEEEDE